MFIINSGIFLLFITFQALLQVIQDQSTEIQRLKETEQNTSRKTASEETLVKSDGCGGQSP
uniref:Uncharacterized protein n=1 Tax=Meloidogyne javanica TaxID=6303 RepID=A0A915MKR0_MELJA